ncbi:Lipopolysaccharide-modifying protein [Macleaya cordata]|uniref:Lipopolysaccharide-modifying protein n=1 Tax=Macleaya cordata TaxID=56857 RepID=A0A200Q8W3_MACCD|nr:Lipopolysaccharide-modifying protein [Macleaya cordata]
MMMMMKWLLPVVKNNIKAPAAAARRITTTTTVVALLILGFFFFAAYIYSRSIDSSILTNSRGGLNEGIPTSKNTHILIPKKKKPQKRLEIPLNCSTGNLTHTCSSNYPVTLISSSTTKDASTQVCPEYFRWIHEDLQPWKNTGITSEMVRRAKRTANFRLVIVKGKAYVEMYMKSFQSRDTFTLWGILQLLRRYPGKLPDLDMMFDCVDWPVIKSSNYLQPNATAPPPVFRYCGNDLTLDIVFPDWSFWGWPEINIKPWDTLFEELKEGNKRTKWIERDPYAYWKGNPVVAATRQDLLKCNVSDKHDWNARLYAQDWVGETQKGFQESNLANQCTHRYKIYIEGSAWSVSEKYILACDSLTLLVKPLYYDFFTRSLVPMQHYWPIKENDKCRSIKFAVDWGNNHQQKVQDIGKAASSFIQKDLRMDYVYDYMFHLLNEYAKLLRYKPTIPPKAVELCSETMACPANGFTKKFMMESMVKYPSDTGPCTIPPPFDPPYLQAFIKQKEDTIRKVEMWKNKFWESQPK